jgi:hypothetical protein
MGEFHVRFLKEEDQAMLEEWWREARLEAPNPAFWPETSFLLSIEGVPAVAVSLIVTNARIGWLDNLVSNPNVRKRRAEGLRFLQAAMELVAEGRGLKRLFCMSLKPSTSRLYRSLGYRKTANVDTLIKEIS